MKEQKKPIMWVVTHDYMCDVCHKQFNWNKKSLRYGKIEYETIDEQKRIERIYCSTECAEKDKENQK